MRVTNSRYFYAHKAMVIASGTRDHTTIHKKTTLPRLSLDYLGSAVYEVQLLLGGEYRYAPFALIHLNDILDTHLLNLADKLVVIVRHHEQLITLLELCIALRHKVLSTTVDHNHECVAWEANIS